MPRGNEKGFVLIVVLLAVVLLAVTAMALNRNAGLQTRMISNQARSHQTYFDQMAAAEQAIWKLTLDPCWRTDSAGEAYSYNGSTYTRTVLNATLSGYTDALAVSIQSPGALKPLTTFFRYYIDTPFLVKKPNQVYRDAADNVYFADVDNHSVWKIEALSGVLFRIAGTGTSGSDGDGGPAVQARLSSPQGVCGDPSGNIYVADTGNHRVRRIDISGNITAYAGTGLPGRTGDNGPSVLATLNAPQGVCADAAGNIYISDTLNHVIRKVTASAPHIIGNFAGTGAAGYGGDGGPANLAQLRQPHGIKTDPAGNIYFADTGNQRVRKINGAAPFNINTVAGTGTQGASGDGGAATSAQLNDPEGVGLDAAGNILIADTGNSRVRKVTVSTGIIQTFAGTGASGYSGDGGAAVAAQIDSPRSACVLASGAVVIADSINCCLRQVSTGGIISTLPVTAGKGLNAPEQVALFYDSIAGKYDLLIADKDNHRIRRLDTVTLAMTTVAGTGTSGYSGDGGGAVSANLNAPEGICSDAGGNLYISDTGNHRIRRVDAQTGIVTLVAGTGVAGLTGDGGAATAARLDGPQGIALDASGHIYFADSNNHRIRKVNAITGIISTVAGTFRGESGDGGPATAAKLDNPRSVFISAAGGMYISDSGNHRVRLVDSQTGTITTIAGTGHAGFTGDGGPATSARLNMPEEVCVDANGNIFIADQENDAIRAINARDGTISTLAGTGLAGFNGDGLPAVQARLNSPSGVVLAAVRGGSRIYIADTDNNRIRLVNLKRVGELY